MSPRRKLVAMLALGIFVSAGFCATANAQRLGSGDLLVSVGSDLTGLAGTPNKIYEISLAGPLVRIIDIPKSNGAVRNITVDPRGRIQAFIGSASPSLRSYTLATNAWTSAKVSGWGVGSDISYGGIGAYKNFVFVTNMATTGNGGSNGIIRFNTNDGTTQQFANGVDFINLNIGYDGLLYAIATVDSAGTPIYVFDPDTLAPVRSFHLPLDSEGEFRSIAVAQNGDLFAVGLAGVVNHFDGQGNLIKSGFIGKTNSLSLALAQDGRIAVSREDGFVTLTDITLGAFKSFRVYGSYHSSAWSLYVTWAPLINRTDLLGNGMSDIIVQNTQTGDVSYWLLNGTQYNNKSGVIEPGIPLEWKVVGAPDLTGDGEPDLLWQDQNTGDVVYWIMNHTQYTGTWSTIAQNIPLEWKIVGTPDIDGDGEPDILWQNQKTGDILYWIMNRTQYTAQWGYIWQGISTQWKIVGTPDLNGDGKPDLLWQNTQTGDVLYWIMDGPVYTGQWGYIWQGISTDWQIVGTPDLNGDGYADILWQNTQTGEIIYWLMNGSVYTGQWGIIAQQPPPNIQAAVCE